MTLQTHTQDTWPPLPPHAPKSSVPDELPGIREPPSLPEIREPPSLPETREPPSLPEIQEPPSLPEGPPELPARPDEPLPRELPADLRPAPSSSPSPVRSPLPRSPLPRSPPLRELPASRATPPAASPAASSDPPLEAKGSLEQPRAQLDARRARRQSTPREARAASAPTAAVVPAAPRRGFLGRLVRRPPLWLGLAAVVAAGSYAAVSARGPLVTTVEVVRRDLEQHLVASGRVWVPSRVQVSAQTAGVAVAVAVDEGDEVRAGDLLVQLDDTELRAGVAQAQAVVAQAEAQVAQLRSVGVVVARARLDQADTSLDRAADALDRARELGAQGAIARVELEEAERVEGVARAQQVTAAAQRRATAPRGVDSQAALASLQLAQAALVAVEARLAQRRILAPRQALVLTRSVEPGDMVQPGRVLLVLAAGAEAAQLVFQADERNLAIIDVGQAAVASADAYPDRVFAGVLSYIAPSIDAARGSVEVRVSMAEVPDYLKPDMTVSIDVTVARRSDVLTIDADAVHGAATRTPWTWVVEDGRLVRREVTLGLRGSGSLEVRSGLEPGTAVALPGEVVQSAGQRVRSAAQEL